MTTHIAVGALVALHIPNAPAAFIAGFISHLLIDMIPHGDAHMYQEYKRHVKVKSALLKVTLDALFAIMMTAWIFAYIPLEHPRIIVWGLIGSVLPDMLVGLCEFVKHPWLIKFHKVHFYFHNYFVNRKQDMTLYHGLIMQLLILAILIKKII